MKKSFSKYKDTPEYVTELARENRRKPTVQERKLWEFLSSRKLNGLKFRNQFPIGRYIVDFCNHPNRLVIEVDGNIHDSTKEYDGNRDNYLNACGYSVLRFKNSEIEENIDTVLGKILEKINNPVPHSPLVNAPCSPTPSSNSKGRPQGDDLRGNI